MSDSQTDTESSARDPIADQLNLKTAHQAQAMDAIMMDRCLLRRDMRASQNKQYGLPQENLEDVCDEDDMGVQVGDNKTDNSVVHNHYHNETPTPTPDPCPPRPGKIPWWLIVLLVVPWIILAVWLAADGGGGSNQPVIWQLDIGSGDPPTPIETATSQE